MKCPYCGVESQPNSQFCHNCGARLAVQALRSQQPRQNPQPYQPLPTDQPPQPAQHAYPPQQVVYPQAQGQQPPVSPANPSAVQPRQPKSLVPKSIALKKILPKEPKKLLILAAAVAAVLVVILGIALLAGGKDAFLLPQGHIFSHYRSDDEETLLYRNGKPMEDVIDGRVDRRLTSQDGNVVAMLTDENELYLVYGKEVRFVTEDVYSDTLSQDGSTLAVINNDNDLTLYDTKSLKATDVAEDAYLAVLSPDGKTLVYAIMEDEEPIVYVFDGKKSTELDEGLAPLVVGNGGKYFYCVSVNLDSDKASFLVLDAKGRKTKLVSELDLTVPIYVNPDHTQVMFSSGGKWYISEKGGEEVKVYTKSDDFQMIHPSFAVGSNAYYGFSVQVVGTEEFGGHFYLGSDTLYYLTGKLECEKVASGVVATQLTRDGSTLFYTRDSGTLYRVDTRHYDDPEEIAKHVEEFRITSDGSAVYFLDDENTLWYQKGTKEAQRVEEDVDRFFITQDDCCLFLCDYKGGRGDLYFCSNGKDADELFSDVNGIYTYATATYISAEYDDEENCMYAATKGDKFELIFEP